MTVTLAPLANLLAVHCSDLSRLDQVEGSIRTRHEFGRIWRPHPAWIMASTPLPFSVPDSDHVAAAGLAFAEGRDLVEESLRDPTVVMRNLSPAGIRSLRGDVGFLAVEPSGQMTIARSAGGAVPFYLYRSGGLVVVATTYTEIVRWLETPPEPDPLVCALWASHIASFPDHRTFLRGIEAVPPGGMAVVDPPSPPTWTQWWEPVPPKVKLASRAELNQAAAEFRRLVIQRLDRDLLPDPGNLLTLSGGTDSSTLAYLAVKELGRPLSALSFVPTPGPALDYEMSFIRPVVDELDIKPHRIEPITMNDRLRFLATAPRLPFFVSHPALAALPSLMESHQPKVLLGGEFADEACGGIFAFPDVAADSTLIDKIRRPRSQFTGRRAGNPRASAGLVPRRLQLASFINDEVVSEWIDRCLREQVRPPWAATRSLLEMSEGVTGMNWEVCASRGVRRAWPFLQRELLELVWSHHPLDVVGTKGKRLLRLAFQGLIPDLVLHRADKGDWQATDQPSIGRQAIPHALRAVVDEGRMRPDDLKPPELLGLTALLQLWKSLPMDAEPSSWCSSGSSSRPGEESMGTKAEEVPERSYEAPAIIDLGTLAELTQGIGAVLPDTLILGVAAIS